MRILFGPVEDGKKSCVADVSTGSDVERLETRAGVRHQRGESVAANPPALRVRDGDVGVDVSAGRQVEVAEGWVGPVGEEAHEGFVGVIGVGADAEFA